MVEIKIRIENNKKPQLNVYALRKFNGASKNMFKAGLFGLWGFLKLSTLLIVFFLLVGFYFWGEKAKEIARPWIEESRKTGVVSYGEGIWNKMKGIQNMRDERAQRAMELAGATKIVTEKANRYSLAVPESWTAEYFALGGGGQMSKIILTSPVFQERKEGTDIFIDNGARLTIQAIRGEQSSVKAEDGGHGKNLIRKAATFVSGMGLNYHAIKDPLVKKGEVYDLHVLFGGNTYLFRYVFSPEKFNGGEFTFQEMLVSLKFGK